MKFFSLSLLASSVLAAPLVKRQTAITDADILQYALTLEHLENVFYKQAVSMMPRDQFLAAGFSPEYYDNLKFIVHDEEAHVELLTSALSAAGVTPVAACEYSFGFTDVRSFVTLATVLEGVGVAAYLGGAPLITEKAYLGVAGSILVTESLHTAVQRFNLGLTAAANPYGSALGPNQVFTLAAAFITACPSSNPPLPFKAFPNLVASQGIPTAPGIDFTFMSSPLPTGTFFVTFVSGLLVMSEAATVSNGMIMTTIPLMAQGQSYAFVTSTNVTGTLMDSDILFGPAILEVTPPSPTFDLTVL